jgi:hypothetical protein
MSQFDQTIPVLTEVFSDKADKSAAPTFAQQVHDEINASLEARAIATWTEPEWTLIERRLTERVVQQLQTRVDFVLEQRLRDSMEEVLKHAVAGLTGELRAGLQDTIEKIVVRAVAQELAHLQALKK